MRIGAVSGNTPYMIGMPNDWLIGSDEDEAAKLGITGITDSGKAGMNEDSEKVGKADKNPGASKEVQPGRKSSPADCETCRERKYQDGSDEMVSFKAAAHISPEASAARVRAHEQEHVNNAYEKAAQMKGGKVLQASVQIKTAICPECGRSYVEGGVTHTQIAYQEESPYSKAKKAQEGPALSGMNFEAGV